MRRRTFLAALGVASLGTPAAAARGGAATGIETVDPLAFDSTASLLAADGTRLADPSTVAVWAEETARNVDADGNGDAVDYGDDRVPLVAVDGTVMGLGVPLVTDDTDFSYGNEEFLLNAWDALVGGGTVLWDEGHGQFYDLGKFAAFEGYAEAAGYDVRATTDLAADIPAADALVVTSPSEALTDAELAAVADFVAGGGAVFLHDQSDFRDFDATANLDAVAAALDLEFRFNDDQVVDPTSNAGVDFVPVTTAFNADFPFFADREGLDAVPDFEVGETYTATVVDVADGDTVDVQFPAGGVESVRVLGVDTPESAAAADAERPEEWEGLADETDDYVPTLDAVQFPSTCSLLGADGTRLADPDPVAVWAAETARNVDADGNGDAVDYGDDRVPLVASAGDVVAVGSPLVGDGFPAELGNEEFLLNVWDAHVDAGAGDAPTVRWDEGHGQFYTAAECSTFVDYAETEGYDVRPTTDLAADLPAADGLVLTSPATALSADELAAVADFVAGGGAVFLHDQADFRDFDATAAMNDVAAALDLPVRFNDDQVLDDANNTGEPFRPTTDAFDTDFPYFAVRPGIDGEGAPAYPYLVKWAGEASAFARERLLGETVDLAFDPAEGIRDPFGRLLAYVGYDADGDGGRDSLYNADLLAGGYARLYDSGLTRHDAFADLEAAARAAGRGLWAESDPDASPPIRNGPVESVFLPEPAAVTAEPGTLGRGRVPLFAGETASVPGAPLAAVDRGARVALVGAPLVDEAYEAREGFPVDTAGYGNFAFLTNLVETLSAREGDVLVDGGHGQFGADYALSAEDAAYYLRYLEGLDVGLSGVNDLTPANLAGGRAVLVTTPPEALEESAIEALAAFRDDGGAVVLLGSGAAPADAVANLNAVAAGLETRLRCTTTAVTDPAANVADDPTLPVTDRFNPAFDLQGPAGDGPGRGQESSN